MQAGETLMGFPGGQSRASPLEAHQQQQLSLVGAAGPSAAQATGNATTLATTTCHQVLSSSSSSYDNNNITSQQLIYSAAADRHEQQVVAPTTNNFQQHATPPPPVTNAHHSAGHASHQHQHSHHNTSNNESYLHLHQGTNHPHHSNLVRKHQHKHQSHSGNHQHTSSSSSGAAKAKQQIAEYAVQQATAAASASQQQQHSLLATTTTTTGRRDDSARSPDTNLGTGEVGVVSPAQMPGQYVPQPRARVGSISGPRRHVTPTSSYSPTPMVQTAPHVRSLSFSAASASDALLAARAQLQPTSSGELCFLSDTSASYQQAHLAMAGGDPYATAGGYQTPSLLGSSACSSIGSPPAAQQPASLLASQQSPPPVTQHQLSAGNSILYNNNITGQQQQQYYAAPVYQQHVPQPNHHSYGGGNSSAPSGGSSTISTSDSLNMSINLEQYISKRNERERSRVRNVNDAFDHLKNSLPLETEKMSKRMSKVEILRTAIGYIRDLENTLGCSPADQKQQPLRVPSGGNRNRHGSFGASSGEQIVACAKLALRREFGGAARQGPMAGENRAGNFAGPAHELQHNFQPQHQRQPFQQDLNHDNRYSYHYTLHNNNDNNSHGFRDYSGPGAKGEGYDCRHDQQQQLVMMNFE